MIYNPQIDSLEKAVTQKNRVIVQLNKPGTQNCSRSKLSIAQVRARPEYTDPYVALGYNTLQVNVNSSKISDLDTPKPQLHFDCVGNGFDANTRSEMSSMMDQLLFKHRNCCMVRCVGKRELSAAILNHLLVCEVDKRFRSANMNITCIQCEYYDIRKFDVVNLVSGATKTKKFMNTMDIQRWLNGEYQEMAAGCQGHECLDFTFSYSDRKKIPHLVKFTYIQIVANKLSPDDKVAFCNCLKNISVRPKGTTSMLVDTLRDYYSPSHDMQMWMFFDIPVQRLKGGVIDDMLKFAKAAYAGFNTRLNKGVVTLENEQMA